jgi:protein-L-isoaspartate O-methyltransferase
MLWSMSVTTDWDAWHEPYESEDSPLSRRLRIVQAHLRAELDATLPRPVTVVSSCAGDGRDLLQVLASRGDSDRITAFLLEQDARLVARARAAIDDAGLRNVSVTRTDASRSDAYRGLVPADIVLLCGIFGNIADKDVQGLIQTLPQFCRTGALVIWTRHRRAPDLTPRIRAELEASGFDEVSFTAPPDVVFSVGAHRFIHSPTALVLGRTLFTFER